jgi:DNA-binding protein|tara:strand:- start:275 stop:628 length:354 start_codon:yes stop_codon:yes gene_type:complete
MAKDIILIGGKPFMSYVTAVVMQFTTNNKNSVTLKSRGKFISRAVDVAEIVNTRFLTDKIKIGDIKIGSEEFKNQENKNIRVSTIDIKLLKTGEIDTDTNSKVINEEPVLQIIKEEE